MPRISMRRRATFALAAAVTAGLVLSACAPATQNGPAGGSTSQSNPDGEIVWAISGANLSNGHMDPQVSQLDVSAMVQRNVLDSLVFQNADGSFSPWLAAEWTVSEDAKTYTFTLRDDVTFHDGEAFNAQAVKVNFDRIMDPATASTQASSMLGGENYAGTEVVDEFTVAVSFHEPYAPFLAMASAAQLGFYSPKVIAEQGDALKAGGPGISVGTGPFTLVEYTPDQSIVYERNEDYAWGPKGAVAPAFKTLRVELVPEPAVRAGLINGNEAQVASDFTPDIVSTLDSALEAKVTEYPGLPYSLFLNEAYGVFADQKVRQAFSRAIDIDAAVGGVFEGQYDRAWSILGTTTPGYDASLEGTWAFDQDVANQLLDEAGWTTRDSDGYRTKDGKRLSARWIAWTPVSDANAALANAVQSDLKSVGFEIVREVLEPGAYNEQYGPKTFDITDWGFSGVDPDLLRSHLATEGFQNASQVSDVDLDRLLTEGATATDQAARNDIYGQIQQWNAQHVAIVPIYIPGQITASSSTVHNLTYDLYGRPLFATASVE